MKENNATNKECVTGKSPTGHCGSAFYCAEPMTCCAACHEDCNMRCGWIEGKEKG